MKQVLFFDVYVICITLVPDTKKSGSASSPLGAEAGHVKFSHGA